MELAYDPSAWTFTREENGSISGCPADPGCSWATVILTAADSEAEVCRPREPIGRTDRFYGHIGNRTHHADTLDIFIEERDLGCRNLAAPLPSACFVHEGQVHYIEAKFGCRGAPYRMEWFDQLLSGLIAE